MAGLSENMSYGNLMDDLSSAWRMVSVPYPPKRDNKKVLSAPQLPCPLIHEGN